MISRTTVFVALVLAFAVLAPRPVHAQTVAYADSSSTSSAAGVKVSMSGVDDIGGVFVLNAVSIARMQAGASLSAAHECRWDNDDGSGSWSLGSDLEQGENIIALALYNLVYTGFTMRSSGGKYSHDFRLTGDGSTVWSGSKVVDNNSRGLKLVVFAKAVRSGDKVTFQALSTNEKVMLAGVEMAIKAAYDGEGSADINWSPILQELSR